MFGDLRRSKYSYSEAQVMGHFINQSMCKRVWDEGVEQSIADEFVVSVLEDIFSYLGLNNSKHIKVVFWVVDEVSELFIMFELFDQIEQICVFLPRILKISQVPSQSIGLECVHQAEQFPCLNITLTELSEESFRVKVKVIFHAQRIVVAYEIKNYGTFQTILLILHSEVSLMSSK